MSELLGSDTFEGVTVIDLTRLLPGPFASMLLADLGARVIKVEPPRGGDYARWTPPQVESAPGGYGAFFEALNRGKQSVGLDLKQAEGQRLFRDLVASADVVIESFRPGVMERLGFGADTLRELNPGLVVASISSFGQDGPLATRAGHDVNFLARAGMLGLNGPSSGAPNIPSVQIGDVAGGALYTAFAVAAALFRRERTGRGAAIDISMTEGVLSLLGPVINTYAASGYAPGRGQDTLSGGLPCYRIYTTADGGHFAVGALEPKFWAQVCEVMGHPEWSGDALLHGEAGEEASARIQAVFSTKTRDEWTEIFAAIDACTEPVKELSEVVDDELFRARQVIRETPEGRLAVVAPTSRNVAEASTRPAPLLGEHTEALAASFGWDADAIAAALETGAIAANRRDA